DGLPPTVLVDDLAARRDHVAQPYHRGRLPRGRRGRAGLVRRRRLTRARAARGRRSGGLIRLRAGGSALADLDDDVPNSSGSISRPRVLIVSWNCCPFGTGCWPICPAATWTFCAPMALTTSAAVRLSEASFCGSSHARML